MTRIECETIIKAGYILDALEASGIEALCISHRVHTVYVSAPKLETWAALTPDLRLGTIMYGEDAEFNALS